MLKKFAVPVAFLMIFLLLVFPIIIALQPAQFTVTRSIVINAPPQAPFELVHDFRKWQEWSPWEKMDPNLKRTYDGADAGEGAQYHWVGNDKGGEGKMAITKTKPHEQVLLDLNFIKPFEAKYGTEFSFTPEGEGTRVTWTMTGENTFLGKAMSLIQDMDQMIGKDFEKGLADMKTVAEAKAASPASTEQPRPAAPTEAQPAEAAPTLAEPAKP